MGGQKGKVAGNGNAKCQAKPKIIQELTECVRTYLSLPRYIPGLEAPTLE
jgi:hypothetical protein